VAIKSVFIVLFIVVDFALRKCDILKTFPICCTHIIIKVSV